MTDSLTVRIAKLLGLEVIEETTWIGRRYEKVVVRAVDGQVRAIPDFLHDLNASLSLVDSKDYLVEFDYCSNNGHEGCHITSKQLPLGAIGSVFHGYGDTRQEAAAIAVEKLLLSTQTVLNTDTK